MFNKLFSFVNFSDTQNTAMTVSRLHFCTSLWRSFLNIHKGRIIDHTLASNPNNSETFTLFQFRHVQFRQLQRAKIRDAQTF